MGEKADASGSVVSGRGNIPKGTIRRRKAGGSSTNSNVGRGTGSQSGMMRLYTDDSPGLIIEPVVVLVASLVFIASVFMLHIYGKLTRG